MFRLNKGSAHTDYLINKYRLREKCGNIVTYDGTALTTEANAEDMDFITKNKDYIIARLIDMATAKSISVNTGKRQVIAEYLEHCRDGMKDCNADIITHSALPDGTIEIIRRHTGGQLRYEEIIITGQS